MNTDYEWYVDDPPPPTRPVEEGQRAGLGLVGLFVLVFFFYNVYKDAVLEETLTASASAVSVEAHVDVLQQTAQPTTMLLAAVTDESQAPVEWSAAELEAFEAPYKKFSITQGLHGQSYDHLAVDLAAGKGKPILSPINGVITERYIDEYGNTTLVIENAVFRVTLLHGKYSVDIGELVRIGNKIGVESNRGYVTDLNGVPCSTNDCGFHTHLNVYDKRKEKNVNPLNLIK